MNVPPYDNLVSPNGVTKRILAYLELQSRLATRTQAVVVLLVNGGEVSFGHHMGTNKLADLLAEAKLTKISLAKNFMACFANISPIVVDHRRHLVCCWDETTDIMEQGAKDGLFIGAWIKVNGVQPSRLD